MTRSRLLLAVAAVLAGAASLFVVLGAVFNPLLAAVALPFGLAAYLLWSHATGRLERRVRREAAERLRQERAQQPGGWAGVGADGRREGPGPGRAAGAGRAAGSSGRPGGDASSRSMDRGEALAVLGLSPEATQPAIRRAYRERAKAVHPDAEGGDEEAFRRVQAAYERLRRR